MKTRISKSDFTFLPAGHGQYKATYQSPHTGIKWTTLITDMELIDATKNSENPKIKDLVKHKYYCQY